ncbi:response regulator transcription factor [Stieleria varia]|uniref:Transcriptional regulatory protein WalR n=1 Tax=Stieleria varia TaxID=2528005 RepID=A0A5C6ASJ2_9BACT|nr:response regulator transcription factor [Stieleria varia]TWU02650.1 Transcriptional regulatory protein WalR [Stieleria varia]
MTLRILIAEDDRNTRAALAEVLRGEGYEVTEAADGRHAKDLFDAKTPDIACLDVMMPGLSGFDLCRHFRQTAPTMPILFITAKSEEIDKVVGLELGGDDYIVKPFGTKEVIARIRAVTRRCVPADDFTPCGFGTDEFDMHDLHVIPKEYRARRGTETISLTPRELRILQCLADRPGEVIPRSDLFRQAWEDDHVPNSRTIDQTISQLRKRIERNPKSPEIIETVYGVGYRFQPASSSPKF